MVGGFFVDTGDALLEIQNFKFASPRAETHYPVTSYFTSSVRLLKVDLTFHANAKFTSVKRIGKVTHLAY